VHKGTLRCIKLAVSQIRTGGHRFAVIRARFKVRD